MKLLLNCSSKSLLSLTIISSQFFCLLIIIGACIYHPILLAVPDEEAVEKLINDQVKREQFEGTILLADKGKVIYHQSFGSIDEEQKVPVTNQARFSAASITKTFTALLILQLIEQDKLAVTDTVHDLLPELSIPQAQAISVHHLLLHISGLPNETGLFYQTHKTPSEFINAVLKQAKGEQQAVGRFNYANIDYVLLGLIIEKVTNKSWYEMITEQFIKPLNLNDTGFLKRDNYPDNFAYTYSFFEGKRTKDPAFYVENFYSSAAMYTSASDLLTLDQALYDNSIINQASKKMLYTSYPEYNYTGYSVWTYNYPFVQPTTKIMERRGGIMGANNAFIRLLDLNRTIIILSNNNLFNPDTFGATDSLKESLIIQMATYQ